MARIFLTTTGAGSWTVPDDWDSANNTIECLGGGAAGTWRSGQGSAGSGGGAYAKVSNLDLTPGASIPYSVGVGGTVQASDVRGGMGGDTWFGNATYASASVGAKGGSSAVNEYTPGIGGQASASIGDVKYNGGNGATSQYDTGGGGGAAGPNGAGNNGIAGGAGGSGDAGYGGAGSARNSSSAAGDGTEWDATHGSGGGAGGYSTARAGLYGGGGGGPIGTNGGPGTQGIIVITYTPLVAGTSQFFQLF